MGGVYLVDAKQPTLEALQALEHKGLITPRVGCPWAPHLHAIFAQVRAQKLNVLPDLLAGSSVVVRIDKPFEDLCGVCVPSAEVARHGSLASFIKGHVRSPDDVTACYLLAAGTPGYATARSMLDSGEVEMFAPRFMYRPSLELHPRHISPPTTLFSAISGATPLSADDAVSASGALVLLTIVNSSWIDRSMGVLMELPRDEAAMRDALRGALMRVVGSGGSLPDVQGVYSLLSTASLYTFSGAYSLESMCGEANVLPLRPALWTTHFAGIALRSSTRLPLDQAAELLNELHGKSASNHSTSQGDPRARMLKRMSTGSLLRRKSVTAIGGLLPSSVKERTSQVFHTSARLVGVGRASAKVYAVNADLFAPPPASATVGLLVRFEAGKMCPQIPAGPLNPKPRDLPAEWIRQGLNRNLVVPFFSNADMPPAAPLNPAPLPLSVEENQQAQRNRLAALKEKAEADEKAAVLARLAAAKVAAQRETAETVAAGAQAAQRMATQKAAAARAEAERKAAEEAAAEEQAAAERMATEKAAAERVAAMEAAQKAAAANAAAKRTAAAEAAEKAAAAEKVAAAQKAAAEKAAAEKAAAEKVAAEKMAAAAPLRLNPEQRMELAQQALSKNLVTPIVESINKPLPFSSILPLPSSLLTPPSSVRQPQPFRTALEQTRAELAAMEPDAGAPHPSVRARTPVTKMPGRPSSMFSTMLQQTRAELAAMTLESTQLREEHERQQRRVAELDCPQRRPMTSAGVLPAHDEVEHPTSESGRYVLEASSAGSSGLLSPRLQQMLTNLSQNNLGQSCGRLLDPSIMPPAVKPAAQPNLLGDLLSGSPHGNEVLSPATLTLTDLDGTEHFSMSTPRPPNVPAPMVSEVTDDGTRSSGLRSPGRVLPIVSTSPNASLGRVGRSPDDSEVFDSAFVGVSRPADDSDLFDSVVLLEQ